MRDRTRGDLFIPLENLQQPRWGYPNGVGSGRKARVSAPSRSLIFGPTYTLIAFCLVPNWLAALSQ